jgi:hypothetical protein
MNPKVTTALIYSAKNAVNAALTATLPNGAIAGAATFGIDLQDMAGLRYTWKHWLLVALSAVIAREVGIWLPKLYAWSKTDTNGSHPT